MASVYEMGGTEDVLDYFNISEIQTLIKDSIASDDSLPGDHVDMLRPMWTRYNNIVEVEVNGNSYTVELEKTETPAPVVAAVRPAAPVAATTPVARPAAPSAGAGVVKAPLPGTIVDIKVSVGDKVEPNTVVAILEAMKMENNINAGRAGVVKSINVNKGDSVLDGTDILVIE